MGPMELMMLMQMGQQMNSGLAPPPPPAAEPPKAPADPLANDVLMQMFLNDPAFASLCAGAALPAADSP